MCNHRLICNQWLLRVSNCQVAHLDGRPNTKQKEKTSMYLVMGITGKVGGATARHLLKQGKQIRALVRNREKAAKWADQGVELVEGDWNDVTAIAADPKGWGGACLLCYRLSGHPRLISKRQRT